MPATGSPMVLMIVLGGLLLGVGTALLVRLKG
jgi:LPXTG-motif cell wall-anchored protein